MTCAQHATVVSRTCLNSKNIIAPKLSHSTPLNARHNLHVVQELHLVSLSNQILTHSAPSTMSEAPRVDLPVFPDLDTSAPSNGTSIQSSTQPQTNGSTNGNLAQSAQKAGNSILESEVCGTRAPPHFAETQTNAIHHSLICTLHTLRSPS